MRPVVQQWWTNSVFKSCRVRGHHRIRAMFFQSCPSRSCLAYLNHVTLPALYLVHKSTLVIRRGLVLGFGDNPRNVRNGLNAVWTSRGLKAPTYGFQYTMDIWNAHSSFLKLRAWSGGQNSRPLVAFQCSSYESLRVASVTETTDDNVILLT